MLYFLHMSAGKGSYTTLFHLQKAGIPHCVQTGFLKVGFVCVLDINECAVGTHNCHADSNCSNTKGSYYCTCLTGYSGNGVSCVGMCGNLCFIIKLRKLFSLWNIKVRDNSCKRRQHNYTW